MKCVLKVLMIIFLILLIVFTSLPTYAMSAEALISRGFYKKSTSDFYEIDYSINTFEIIKTNLSLKIFIGVLIIYLIAQVIIILRNKQIKQRIYHNSVVLLIMLSIYFINSISGLFTIEEYLLIYYIYSIALIISLIIQIVHFKEQKSTKNLNNRLIIISIINIIIITIYIVIPKIQITTDEWSFGVSFNMNRYERIILKNNLNLGFKVIDTDKDGVLIEYKLKNYTYDAEKRHESIEEETIQEKLKWNKTYSWNREKHSPMLAVDGGTDYYVRFKK